MLNNKRLSYIFAGFVVALFFTLCACDSNSKQTAEEEKIFRLGVLGPFSGSNEMIGTEFKHAVEMAFEQIDYRINDYLVELVWIDSQSDPERATLAYERAAVDEKVDACILNWHSSVAVAAMDVSARHEIPHFFGLGATEIVNEKLEYDPHFYRYYMAKGWPSPTNLAGAYVLTIEEAINSGLWLPEEKTIALFGEDSAWGHSFSGAISNDFIDAGWEVVTSEYFPVGDTDLYYLANRLADSQVAVIAGSVATSSSFDAFIRELYEIGTDSLIIADGLGWSVGSRQTILAYGDYILSQAPRWRAEKSEQFVKQYEARAESPPSPAVAGLAYDYANFFIHIADETLKVYGELSRESLYRYGSEQLSRGLISYSDGVVMENYRYSEESYPDPVVGENDFLFPVIQSIEGEQRIVWPVSENEENYIPPTFP